MVPALVEPLLGKHGPIGQQEDFAPVRIEALDAQGGGETMQALVSGSDAVALATGAAASSRPA